MKALAPQRRLDMGGMPQAPALLLSVAALLVLFAVAGGIHTLVVLRPLLADLPGSAWWFDSLVAALMLLALAILRPLVAAGSRVRRLRAAARRADMASARVARAECDEKAWVAMSWAVAQMIVIVLVQFLIANDMAVANTFFYLPLIVKTFPLILSAFWLNVKLFMISEVFVLIWGLVLALASLAPGPAGRPLRFLATLYIDVFRAIPVVLIIFLVGFGIPLTEVPVLRDLSQNTFVIIALTLTVSAYVAEIYRAGIMSIHWSQTAAARSLGLSHFQTLRFVIVPQGVRQIIPPLLNSFIALQKDTALVSVVGAIDAFNQSMIVASNYYNLSAVSTVAVLFVIISIPQTRLVERMMQRDRARMRAQA